MPENDLEALAVAALANVANDDHQAAYRSLLMLDREGRRRVGDWLDILDALIARANRAELADLADRAARVDPTITREHNRISDGPVRGRRGPAGMPPS